MRGFEKPIANLIRTATYYCRAPFIDAGHPEDTDLFLAGMGRGGTTWAGDVINYDKRYRVLFEPFHPEHVALARKFERPQYIRPSDIDHPLAPAAQKILAGKPHGEWVDRDNPSHGYQRRFIKEIQANLMLGWLANIRPNMTIVLVVRHPLAVLASWKSLGWASAVPNTVRGFERIVANQQLLADYPLLTPLIADLDTTDPLDRAVFQWAVYHYVPIQQLGSRFHTLYYERLILDPEAETKRLFAFLNRQYDPQQVATALRTESSTNFLKRDISKRDHNTISKWKSNFAPHEIDRAETILAPLGLNAVYDADGYPQHDHLADALLTT